jgi:hypothetical protein
VKILDESHESCLPEELYEELCVIGEEAARKYITSKVSRRGIFDLSVSVSSEQSKGLNVEVDIDLALSSTERGVDERKLAEEAVKVAL